MTNLCTPECANGVCELNLDVHAVRFESVAREPRADVTVRITTAEGIVNVSNAQGLVSLKQLPASTAVELELGFEQLDPEVTEVIRTRYLGPNLEKPESIAVPVVKFRWLAQVATDCGIFPDLATALYRPGGDTVSYYYTMRAAVIGEVFEADGTPATLSRGQIKVLDDEWSNTHGNPDDIDDYPAHVCMLEVDAASGEYVGTTADTTNSGRFVMFRVRNQRKLPTGYAQVQITGFPQGLVALRSAGDVGVVRMQKGVPSPMLPSTSFALNVYPLMQQYGCPGCHVPGEPGYDDSMTRGGFKADYSGTAEDVRAVLLAGADVSCSAANPARVCLQAPEESLFYTKPRTEAGTQDHAGIALPADSAALAVFLGWIMNGAKP